MNRKSPNEQTVYLTDESTEDEREQAREMYGSDDVEIDGNARTSRADDGVWVGAWVWVPNDESACTDDHGCGETPCVCRPPDS
jgi:hypothetical protein